ncbi:hypothetical protein NM518_2196 [Neisseria meningitidis NM518]|nr:hypothetical protein NM518_2196 [Neisseria meningitidis NM518]
MCCRAGLTHDDDFPSSFSVKAGIRSVRFRSFPINSCCFSFLDSHFRGNDGGEVFVVSDKFLRH